MKLKFYAHASFRLEEEGFSVVTDPYTPSLAGFGRKPNAPKESAPPENAR